MINLIETLAKELERPRELSPRVLNYIEDNYGADHEKAGRFLTGELPKLEDYEIDLILSPVFTPKLADQAVFAELLGRNSIQRDEWPSLVEQLTARPTRAQLVTLDGASHTVSLREVTLERYVHRLRLEATIPESIFNLIQKSVALTEHPLLKAIARRNAWDSAGGREILETYLAAVTRAGSYSFDDALNLLNLMESRKPTSLTSLVADIPRWREALRQQIDVASGPKPFFSQEVERMHGGGRDQRSHDEARLSAKQNEFEFLERLQRVLI